MADAELSRMAHVRLPVAEYEEFGIAAKRLGDTRSNLLRRAIRDIIERPADLLEKELGALDEAVYQLKAVGRNLNQIARAIHTSEPKDIQVDPVFLATVSEAVVLLDRRLTDVIERSRLRRVIR
ncbi:MAG TPA: plasmid mobilization relaxosome protein MobC [Burkholderiales bacterium]|nr:plasmid mobilization relaxosome protein MobC [Burkholderiales bacterium]